jgi:hypothetical protein
LTVELFSLLSIKVEDIMNFEDDDGLVWFDDNKTFGPSMKFEDTKLRDEPIIREAFQAAGLDASIMAGSNPHLGDDGLSPASLTLRVRAGEILQECISSASAEQIAGAVMFLTPRFVQPTLMRSSYEKIFPKLVEWSEECRLRGGRVSPSSDIQLRQIVLAVNTAFLQGIKDNFADIKNPLALNRELMEYDFAAQSMGELQAPELEKKYKQLRAELETMLAPHIPKKPQPPKGPRF